MEHSIENTYLEWPRDGNKTVRTEVLQARGVDRHQVHDIPGCAASAVIGKYECLLVNGGDESRTDPHTGLETALEVLVQDDSL